MLEYSRQKKEGKEGAPGAVILRCSCYRKGERVGGIGSSIAPKWKGAILIKVEEHRAWIETYKRIVAARNTIDGATEMRTTRAHILIEFDRKIVVSEMAEKLRAALSDATEVSALVNRTTVQIKDIDPLTTKEELVEELKRESGIISEESVELKTLRMAPWGTQVALVVLPASAVPREDVARRFRTGLTITSARSLPDLQRCYKSHMSGHTAARCTVMCPGRELRRRCRSSEHVMKECTKEPKCAMCSKQDGVNAKHVTVLLACPMVRAEGRRRRR